MSEGLPGDKLPEGYGPPEPIPYVPYAPSSGSSEANVPSFVPPIVPSPSMSIASHTPPIQKRSRRGCWITVSLLAVLLLTSAASFFAIRYISRSTPDKTLDIFCNDLQQADYRSAYDQFSTQLRRAVSEVAFAAPLSRDKVLTCSHGTTDDSGNSVINTLKIVHASKGVNNDIVTLTKDGNNDWKIDDIYRQEGASLRELI